MIESLLTNVGLPMLVFAGFIVLTFFVRPGDTPGKSLPLLIFVLYVMGASLWAGYAPRDLWPFAAWRYVSYSIADDGNFVRLVGVDENGRERPLDTRTFEPLEFTEVVNYLEGVAHMPQTQRTELLSFVLRRAQEGLARAHAGLPIGTFRRVLGPLSAPVFHVPDWAWADPEKLPRELVEVRIYRVYWRVSDGAIRTEKLVLEASSRS